MGSLGRMVAAGLSVLGIGVAGLAVGGLPSAAAASAGTARVVKPSNGEALSSGGSATDFGLKLPDDAACTRDSAKGGYRVMSYLVPRSVALESLKFDAGGPEPVAGEFRAPLYDDGGSQYAAKVTANEVKPGGPGPIIQPVATFSFKVYTPAAEGFPLPPGSYNVGIACTLGPPTSATQLDKYWNTVITVSADPGDSPANIRWAVTAPPGGRVAQASQPPVRWMAAAGGGLAAAVGVLVIRRRGRDPVSGPRPSHNVKETR